MKTADKKVVVITGAGKGIGRACALLFAESGYNLAVISRTESDLKKLKSDCKKIGSECLTIAGDASDKKTAELFYKKIDQKFGRIDVLINNAGLFRSESFLEMSEKLFQSQWKTNTLSTFIHSQQTAKRMIRQKYGQIINIISVAAKRSFDGSAAYGSSKFAQDGLAKVMRDELKPHNIRVTNIYPGAAFTNSWAGSKVDENRLMAAADVANAVFSTVNLDKNVVIEELILRHVLGDL